MVTVPGAVEEKTYKWLLMAATLKKTEEASEEMNRFELKVLVEVVKGMGLEPIVKKKLIDKVIKADK